jgi:hypothetical protein
MVDNHVITAFQDGTTCETLVHQIQQVKPKTIRKLLDLATDHTNGEKSIAFSKRKPKEELGEARPPGQRRRRRSGSSAAEPW